MLSQPGAAVKLNQYKREGCKYITSDSISIKFSPNAADTDFVALDPNNGAWNVVRRMFTLHFISDEINISTGPFRIR